MGRAPDWPYDRAATAAFGVPRALRLLGIHQHEDDAARLLAAIDPGVVGRLLHDDVARFEVYGLVVEHHVDLAGHDDGVVDRAGAVLQRIGHRRAAPRRVATGDIHHELGIHGREFGIIDRREFDDTENRAVIRRR